MSTVATIVATITLLVGHVRHSAPISHAYHYHAYHSHVYTAHAAHRAQPPVVYSPPPARSAPVAHLAPATAPRYGNPSLDAISIASARWGVSYGWLLRVASCESGLNPMAYNPSGASGLFQFMPSTFYAFAARIGEFRSIWNPYASANVAAYMFSIGLSYEWTCR